MSLIWTRYIGRASFWSKANLWCAHLDKALCITGLSCAQRSSVFLRGQRFWQERLLSGNIPECGGPLSVGFGAQRIRTQCTQVALGEPKGLYICSCNYITKPWALGCLFIHSNCKPCACKDCFLRKHFANPSCKKWQSSDHSCFIQGRLRLSKLWTTSCSQKWLWEYTLWY